MVAPMSEALTRLHAAVMAARHADPEQSRTARLLQAGRAKMSKKLAEEAIEVVLDAMDGNRDAVVRESADLLYNLVVLWVASDVHPTDVWREMERRERLFGIAEKLLKSTSESKPECKARRNVARIDERPPRKRAKAGR
jgi:phosphoribosyl-ATP pyrophosphohydrolase